MNFRKLSYIFIAFTLLAYTIYKACQWLEYKKILQKQIVTVTMQPGMRKPNGMPPQKFDPLLLLNMWAHHLDRESTSSDPKMIFAGVGKPSYYLDLSAALAATHYWQDYIHRIDQTKEKLILEQTLTLNQRSDVIAQSATAIDYGLAAGEQEAKNLMGLALSRWYNQDIKSDDVVFTVGGLSALKMIFHILNTKNPDGRIITPNPYYPYYNIDEHHNNLHFIDVLQAPGYRLTADALQQSILQANELEKFDRKKISAFLFCDPNNPLGTVINQDEWKKIAEILKSTSSDIPIILDEAYAEMVFGHKHVSLLQIAPELKNRLIILRSATKSLSASGERMAVTICFNQEWKEELVDEILSMYHHAPKSLQYAYAQSLLNFSEEKQRDLIEFYQLQSDYVQNRIKKMNAELPDPDYKIDGTFYVLANLSELIGSPITDSAERALGKQGLIETDVDLCYSLLFQDRVMISPLSFFGVDPKKGYVRITCTGGISQLTELLDRIEKRLNEVRSS